MNGNMDILGEYRKTIKETPAPQKARVEWGDETGQQQAGMLIGVLMKLSGGRIHDASQATGTLLVVMALIFVIALVVFLRA